MNDFWQHCSALLERELTPQQYVTWIKPLAPVAFDAAANTLSIAAPNRFKLDWVKSQFSGRISDMARDFGTRRSTSNLCWTPRPACAARRLLRRRRNVRRNSPATPIGLPWMRRSARFKRPGCAYQRRQWCRERCERRPWRATAP